MCEGMTPSAASSCRLAAVCTYLTLDEVSHAACVSRHAAAVNALSSNAEPLLGARLPSGATAVASLAMVLVWMARSVVSQHRRPAVA